MNKDLRLRRDALIVIIVYIFLHILQYIFYKVRQFETKDQLLILRYLAQQESTR